MKFIHLSDLHLGKRLIEVSLYEDQAYILEEIIRIAAIERPRAVLISGDVYDRSNPPAEAMTLFSRFIRALTRLGCAVLVISGNHDSPERLAYMRELVEENGVYLSPIYDGHVEPIALNDEHGPVFFWPLPFVHPETARARFPEETVANANDALRLALDELHPDAAARNVILSHQLILGSAFEADDQKNVGTLDNVDPALYDAFDYVALGHIHKAQSVGRMDGTMRYAGAPIKYSKKEALSEKTLTIVDMGEKGDVSVRTAPLRPLRELRLKRGAFDRLIAEGPDLGTEDDYFFLTLTDEEDIPNAASRLRERFNRVLAIDFDNARTRRSGQIELKAVDSESKSPMALLMELYSLTRGRDMSDEARAYAERVMRELEGFEA